MRSNIVEYSTAAGVYCTTHEVKVTSCMPDMFCSKTINQHFHVDNDKGNSGIRYKMIIGRDLMLQLGLTAEFKRQVLHRDYTTVLMKEHSGLSAR